MNNTEVNFSHYSTLLSFLYRDDIEVIDVYGKNPNVLAVELGELPESELEGGWKVVYRQN